MTSLDTAVSAPPTQPRPHLRVFAIASIVLGVIGWIASFELAYEYFEVLKNPKHVPACNISPLVTCGPNMDSWQGSLFGFSNTFLGLAAFTAPVFVGFALLAGARMRSWFWWIYILGTFAGVVFVFWLSWQSVFRLGTLCPWCMVVWAVTIPLFWISLLRLPTAGLAKPPASLAPAFAAVYHWTWVLIVFSYLVIAVEAQIGVDWLTHLRLAFS